MEIVMSIVAGVLSLICVSFALYNGCQSRKITKKILDSYKNDGTWRF